MAEQVVWYVDNGSGWCREHDPERLKTESSRTKISDPDAIVTQCVYCGCNLTMRTLTKDHIIPKSRGGKGTWPNIAPACERCNGDKSDLTVRDFLVKRRLSWPN